MNATHRFTAVRMAALLILSTAVVAVAAPARADSPSEYLHRVQDALPTIYEKYGSSALLSEGNRICQMEASHMSAADKIDQVQTDLPMSEGSAVHLIAIANVWLGC